MPTYARSNGSVARSPMSASRTRRGHRSGRNHRNRRSPREMGSPPVVRVRKAPSTPASPREHPNAAHPSMAPHPGRFGRRVWQPHREPLLRRPFRLRGRAGVRSWPRQPPLGLRSCSLFSPSISVLRLLVRGVWRVDDRTTIDVNRHANGARRRHRQHDLSGTASLTLGLPGSCNPMAVRCLRDPAAGRR